MSTVLFNFSYAGNGQLAIVILNSAAFSVKSVETTKLNFDNNLVVLIALRSVTFEWAAESNHDFAIQ
jgi:hypothetical protein